MSVLSFFYIPETVYFLLFHLKGRCLMLGIARLLEHITHNNRSREEGEKKRRRVGTSSVRVSRLYIPRYHQYYMPALSVRMQPRSRMKLIAASQPARQTRKKERTEVDEEKKREMKRKFRLNVPTVC